MAATKKLPQQVVKVKNYGDAWINRLAVVLATVDQMDEGERLAAFRFMKSKYSKEWPSDSY